MYKLIALNKWLIVQDLPENLSDVPANRPPRLYKKPRFSRAETEINSTYVTSHMSQARGDDLLQWACNQAFRHSDVRYKTIRSLSMAIRAAHCPCGTISTNLHEPLDGNQYLWMHRRSMKPTLEMILKDPRFEGEQLKFKYK